VPDRSAAPRPALPNVGMSAGGGGCPEEACELTGNCDGHDTVRFAAGFQLVIDAMQAVLGGVREHVLGLSLLASLQDRSDIGCACVVPGRFDQQTTRSVEPVLVIDP
jgi:hypothetical protein